MESAAFLWAVLIGGCLISTIAGYVGASWHRDSQSSALRKRMNECEATVADLESSFASLLESHKRLRSKMGMQQLRESRGESSRPETKEQARARIFGTAAGPAFARKQQELDSARGNRSL